MILKTLQDQSLQRKARITAPVTDVEKATIEAIVAYRESIGIQTNVGELVRQALFIGLNPDCKIEIKSTSQAHIEKIIESRLADDPPDESIENEP